MRPRPCRLLAVASAKLRQRLFGGGCRLRATIGFNRAASDSSAATCAGTVVPDDGGSMRADLARPLIRSRERQFAQQRLHVEFHGHKLRGQQIEDFGVRGRIVDVMQIDRLDQSPPHQQGPQSIDDIAIERRVVCRWWLAFASSARRLNLGTGRTSLAGAHGVLLSWLEPRLDQRRVAGQPWRNAVARIAGEDRFVVDFAFGQFGVHDLLVLAGEQIPADEKRIRSAE